MNMVLISPHPVGICGQTEITDSVISVINTKLYNRLQLPYRLEPLTACDCLPTCTTDWDEVMHPKAGDGSVRHVSRASQVTAVKMQHHGCLKIVS